MRAFLSIVAAAALSWAGMLGAQDYVGMAQSNMRVVTTGATNRAVFANAFHDGDFGDGKRPRSRATAGKPTHAAQPPTSRGLLSRTFGTPARTASKVALPYAPRAEDARVAKAKFLERLRENDPATATAIADEFGRHDMSQVYAGITQAYGLSPNDAGDVMTAYLLLGWLVANGVYEPPAGSIAAARAAISASLARGGQIADVSTRAKLAEEVKILFVVLHSGWLSARKEGNMIQYAAGVAELFCTATGDDLRRLALGPNGCQPRRMADQINCRPMPGAVGMDRHGANAENQEVLNA